MKKILGTSVIAAVASLAIVGAAQADSMMPPGQGFEATPMQKGPMMQMPSAKLAAPAPAAKKHKMMKHKMAKHKMMKHKMKH